MATNDFLPFAVGGSANVLSQSAYAALSAIANGYSSGVAQSAALNKTWRQSSIMAAVLAQFIADRTGVNSVDDGTTATLLANLKASTAAVNGSASQLFNVADPTTSTNAVSLQYAQANLAGIGGSASRAFAVANASISTQALAAGQLTGQFITSTVITSTQTWTPNAKTKFALVMLQGGGGAGGGAQAGGSGTLNMGGGGGSGGYVEAVVTNPTAQTVTIGAAGIPSGGAGGNGGNTTFGALLTAAGGVGGQVGALITTVSNSGNGGTGGTASGFGLLVVGQNGGNGFAISTLAGLSGYGGSCRFGGGGQPSTANNTAVVNGQGGTGRGSGGSGAIGVNNGSAGSGGTGQAGVAVIYEFGGAF
ncbi:MULTISPECIES: phage tail protein [unclassified Caballeronia]|uniref:glycine-rich domain-containing protein n=1 Tax=unclassified Caballeronia TaxID=2646786 RepID=UPI0020298A2C|nr:MULTISPECIES: phage tail protein [unclassified Caballeronia]